MSCDCLNFLEKIEWWCSKLFSVVYNNVCSRISIWIYNFIPNSQGTYTKFTYIAPYGFNVWKFSTWFQKLLLESFDSPFLSILSKVIVKLLQLILMFSSVRVIYIFITKCKEVNEIEFWNISCNFMIRYNLILSFMSHSDTL